MFIYFARARRLRLSIDFIVLLLSKQFFCITIDVQFARAPNLFESFPFYIDFLINISF